MIKYKEYDVAKKCLLFIHIPKTAGTSFRSAGLQYFGQGHTLLDYGEFSPVTSKAVKNIIYSKSDFFLFQRLLVEKSIHFLSGHYIFSKYAKLFPFFNIISFVRDPVQQVLSHYYHYQRHYAYEKDLISFCEEKRFQNLQSQYLSYTDLSLIGFIGITEKYKESLSYINEYYNLDIVFIEANKNNYKQGKSYVVDDEIKNIILKKNEKDCVLYEKAKKLYDFRINLLKKGQAFVYGTVIQINENMVRGWAVNPFVLKAVNVEIVINNEVVAVLKANEYLPAMKEKNCTRNSFVGFSYNFERKLLKEDDVICRVEGSQQVL